MSESSTALTAVSEPLLDMAWPSAYQMTASTRTVAARQARLVRIVLNESMPVRTVSMPPYAFMPIVASRAVADRNAVIEPSGAATLSPDFCRPTRPSLMPSRVASQAPSAISQMAEPDAPKNTAAMMLRGRVSRGM